MKHGKRFVSFLLTMVMVCSLMVNAGAAEAQEEIKAQLSYDITVSYNGETQALTDAAGNTVYPISYNGTTYLPVRAVSYVLGVAVDWDGATQTVLLSDGEAAAPKAVPASNAPSGSKDITAQLDPGITVKYNGEVQTMTDAAGNTVYPVSYNGTTYLPVRAVSNMLGVVVDWDGETQTVLLRKLVGDTPNVSKNDVFNGAVTSPDAETIGENHIGYDWIEIDWSTVSDSYVCIIVNKLPKGDASVAKCRISWDNDGMCKRSKYYELTEGEWNIPITGGSTEYVVQVSLEALNCEHYRTDEEKEALKSWNTELTARFSAEVENTDGLWLLSTSDVDFMHATKTVEKTLELTTNCKTDAEKITAIFNWVTKNIKYDYNLYSANTANNNKTSCATDPKNGAHTKGINVSTRAYEQQNGLNLDVILTKKTGICGHYAILMAGMLRSLGIPCKVVAGTAVDSNGKRDSHAWVAVKPETGTLDVDKLSAGKDYTFGIGVKPEPTGWTRLDPTWYATGGKTVAANDKNYTPMENY